MIDNIIIKNVTTYDNTGTSVDDLKKVNFFFGYNGSGKSTIAKYLKDLSITEPANKNASYLNCTQTGYDSENNEILVFDQQFIDTNFKSETGKLKGVFSLDEINITIKENLEKNLEKKIFLDKNIDLNNRRIQAIQASQNSNKKKYKKK